MKRKDTPSYNKLEKLKEIRRKRLVRKLLDIQLRGVEHRVHITSDSRADLTVHDGDWVTDHIRTAIVKHNYDINKIPTLQVKDFEVSEIKEYENTKDN
tara:strand:+ start:112 stop:405 length:294 start_codon:yes stop_codon:yes gene_type:complete